MAANDLLTTAEAKRALRITDSASDTAIDEIVTEASMFLDDLCGPIVEREVTEVFLEPTGSVFLKVPPGSPTFTITFGSVTEYNAGVATVLTAEDVDTAGTYRYESRTGALLRRSSWSYTTWGLQEVVVTYTAGRFADTASVSQLFKGACRKVVAHKWQARGYTIAPGAASGGDGPPGFASIPYSPERLVKDLRVDLKGELLLESLGAVIA